MASVEMDLGRLCGLVVRGPGSIPGHISVQRLDDPGVGVRVPVESRMCTYPYRPDLFNGHCGLFPHGWGSGESGRSVKLVPMSRELGSTSSWLSA
jgi:hypothetical protein